MIEMSVLGFFKKERTRPLVLHVDDDRDICAIISLTLKDLGLDSLSAHDGAEGLRVARKELPDLILLDIRMPVMDGFEVCLRLKGDDATKRIPVLMLTAMGQVKDVDKAVAAGADAYLPKPIRYPQLKAKIADLLRLPPKR